MLESIYRMLALAGQRVREANDAENVAEHIFDNTPSRHPSFGARMDAMDRARQVRREAERESDALQARCKVMERRMRHTFSASELFRLFGIGTFRALTVGDLLSRPDSLRPSQRDTLRAFVAAETDSDALDAIWRLMTAVRQNESAKRASATR